MVEITGPSVSIAKAEDVMTLLLAIVSVDCRRTNTVGSPVFGRSVAMSHANVYAVPADAKSKFDVPSDPTPDFSVMVFHTEPLVEYSNVVRLFVSFCASVPVYSMST